MSKRFDMAMGFVIGALLSCANIIAMFPSTSIDNAFAVVVGTGIIFGLAGLPSLS